MELRSCLWSSVLPRQTRCSPALAPRQAADTCWLIVPGATGILARIIQSKTRCDVRFQGRTDTFPLN